MTRRASKIQVLLPIVMVGLLVGFYSGRNVPHARADACSNESIDFGPQDDVVYDTDNGIDEDNRWTMGDGRDYARSLACDDGNLGTDGIAGQNQNDDLGGGSGADFISGNLGNDTIAGGTGGGLFQGPADNLLGQDGADTIVDSQGGDSDIAGGGDGPDDIDVQDGDGYDQIYGGAGADNCTYDSSELNIDSC